MAQAPEVFVSFVFFLQQGKERTWVGRWEKTARRRKNNMVRFKGVMVRVMASVLQGEGERWGDGEGEHEEEEEEEEKMLR